MENNQASMDNMQKDYLTDELNPYFQYEYASIGQRFLNFLIDNLLLSFGFTYVTGFALGFLLANIFPDFINDIAYRSNQFEVLLFSYIVSIFNYLIYYTICEKLFKGYTLGKLITGTRAIREDGQELTFKNTLLRTLSRLAPFEVFSGFGYRPWHDKWTNTMVVKIR